ncbi:MAG TPA: OmpA family protein [Alphaproteobacteria bacterium]|nr:OmpA family protein [Alphaproteobacteria bacterium]
MKSITAYEGKKMRKLAVAVVVVAAGILSATGAYASRYVSDDLATLKAMQARGSAFNQALKQEYQTLGEFEFAQSDHQHAHRDVRKGIAAGSGASVLPEDPRSWYLPDRSRRELIDNHGKLLAALDDGGRERNPAAAARAQVMFDCWVEEEHEDVWYRGAANPYQPEDIKRCKEGFLAAMQELLVAPQQNFIIFFAFDKYNLDAAAMRVVGDIVSAAQKAPNARISVFGFTDRAGSVQYNLELSKRRAQAVSGALTARGIAANRIAASGFGESRPRVPTADGVPEAQNRRAEIEVK